MNIKSKQTMLEAIKATCKICNMCRLGRMTHEHNGKQLDNFHVFSSMTLSRIIIFGQNPGFNECIQDIPFVGDAGEIFNREITKHNIARDMFYISNTVRCHTPNNRKPEQDEINACEPFLKMELNVLKPLLAVTLGAVAFEIVCPELKYSDSLGKLIKSSKYDINVFPIYHPSPRNMADHNRKSKFEEDVATLCDLIKKLQSDYGEALNRFNV